MSLDESHSPELARLSTLRPALEEFVSLDAIQASLPEELSMADSTTFAEQIQRERAQDVVNAAAGFLVEEIAALSVEAQTKQEELDFLREQIALGNMALSLSEPRKEVVNGPRLDMLLAISDHDDFLDALADEPPLRLWFARQGDIIPFDGQFARKNADLVRSYGQTASQLSRAYLPAVRTLRKLGLDDTPTHLWGPVERTTVNSSNALQCFVIKSPEKFFREARRSQRSIGMATAKSLLVVAYIQEDQRSRTELSGE